MKKEVDEIGNSAEEVFAQIGVVLLLVQQFELLVERALKFIYTDKDKITPEEIFKLDKRSLGILLADLRKKANLAQETDLLFKNLLEDRNLFAHRLRQQEWFDAHTKEGRDAFWSFIQQFQQRLDVGIMIFTAILFSRAEELNLAPDFFKKMKDHRFVKEVRSYYPDTLASS
jgi:hypothetical protein